MLAAWFGWINAEPSGDAGPGLNVGDDELSGWMWAENVGWISLSCANTLSCADTGYGVTNDGSGVPLEKRRSFSNTSPDGRYCARSCDRRCGP